MLIDSHAHLNDERFHGKQAEIVEQAFLQGVEKIITIGTDIFTSKESIMFSSQFESVFAAVGIHPHEASTILCEEQYDELINLAKANKVVAIGEIGLDYHYEHSPREKQKDVFRRQVAIARELKKPIIVHDREAHADTMALLKQEAIGLSGVLHCFSGSVEMAREVIKMGFYISVAGPVTFSNAAKLQRVVAEIPLEHMLIETDCPYLAPQPKRGKCNEPSYVRYVAEKIAEIKGVPFEVVAEVTNKNTKRLFGI